MSKSLNKQALKVVIDGTPAERTYLCSKDFSLFLSYYFTEYLKYPYADFHYEWFDDLKDLMGDDIRELALIAFRESAKTSFSKIFLVWLIVYAKRRYINVDSFSITNAERILFDVVFALQTNPKLKSDFGELYNSKRDSNEVTQKRINNFITNNGVRVEAHSTGKSVRGRLHGNQRPDFLLLDDFETNDTKDSKAHTLGVIEHINEFKSGLDSQAKIIYLGNYITESGSVQTLIDRAKTDHRLRVRIVPVEVDGKPTWDSKYAMTDVQALAEGKVSLEDKKRQLGSLVYSTEMLNQPISAESQKFKKAMFKYIAKEKVLAMNTRKFATIDTAMSKEAHSDKTGVVRNYVNVENFWHLSGKNYTVSPKGLIDLIFVLHDEGMEKIGIETTSYTQGIEPFFQEECRKRGKYPYLVQLKHGGVMKETRIESLVAPYEAGSIFHIEGECEEMEEQLLKFPIGLHDDIIDACFVAGTKILTDRGQVNIEDIKSGDIVMTRNGYKKVAQAWCSGKKEVINNLGLIGTKNHPVITKGGIKDLQYVSTSDTLYTWNEKLSSITESNIIDTLKAKENNTEHTSGHIQRIKHLLYHYIDKCGQIIMGLYLKVFTFIIKTKILLTIILKILKSSVHQLTHVYTHLKNIVRLCRERILTLRENTQINGMGQMRVEHGTEYKRNNHYGVNLKVLFVMNVIANTYQTLKDHLSFVLKNVQTEYKQEVLERKIQTTIKRKVYNLEVEDEHEYFANNILVHNCQYQKDIAEPPYRTQILDEYIDDSIRFEEIGI